MWRSIETCPIHLFADARGHPPRLAAVLLADGKTHYTDWEPPPSLLAIFISRKDQQIMGLELLAIALGFSTFANLLEGRRVFVWSDNVGTESCARKGTARQWDHACIVHSLWKRAAALQCELYVERVPTAVNIADLPSREEYKLLHAIRALYCEPYLDTAFWQPDAWEALSLRDV